MTKLLNLLKLPTGNAICYSGYREGQNPNDRTYPSLGEILQDLLILQKNWRLLRLYDSSLHAERVLQVIEENKLPFQVMLGAYLGAEMNNFGCPWGGTFIEEQLEASTRENEAEVGRSVTRGGQSVARHAVPRPSSFKSAPNRPKPRAARSIGAMRPRW